MYTLIPRKWQATVREGRSIPSECNLARALSNPELVLDRLTEPWKGAEADQGADEGEKGEMDVGAALVEGIASDTVGEVGALGVERV